MSPMTMLTPLDMLTARSTSAAVWSGSSLINWSRNTLRVASGKNMPSKESPAPTYINLTAAINEAGGVVGGPHAFLYMIGQENAPATVELVLPPGWTAATGMEPARSGGRTHERSDAR